MIKPQRKSCLTAFTLPSPYVRAVDIILIFLQFFWSHYGSQEAVAGRVRRANIALARNEEAEVGGVRAVDRAIDILQCFAPGQPLMSVLEIQQRVGLSRPTLYRLLQTLAGKGLVVSEGEPQRFRLAHGVMRLANVWLAGMDIIGIARPLLESLRDQSGETAALFVARGAERLCVLECPSRHVLAISRGIGDMGHITQGASGKAILAFLGKAERNAVFASDQVTNAGKYLARELEATRREGYSISRGEVFAGAVAIAAPVFDIRGEVCGSVGLFGPNARLTNTRVVDLVPRLLASARELSTRNGAPVTKCGSPQLGDRRDAPTPP